MSKASDSGKEFLAGVLAKLPTEKRAQAEAIFHGTDVEEALVVIGTGALGQAEINRRFDELKAKETELDQTKAELDELTTKNREWWEEHNAAIKDYMKIKPEYDKLSKGNGNPNPNPNPDPPKAGMTKEELDNYLGERERGQVAVLGLATTLTAKHQQMFGEAPDMNQVMATAVQKRITLQDAYDSVYGVRVQEHNKKLEDKRIEDEVQKRLSEERKKQPVLQPFPLRDASPSPLDALTATDRKPGDYTVDSAAAEYDRLQQARNGAPT
jgi:hypothetical protein